MLRNNLNSALALYDAFTKNAVEGHVDAPTLEHMKAIFFGVDDADKAFVFNVFLQFLQDDGVAYNVEQFQAA